MYNNIQALVFWLVIWLALLLLLLPSCGNAPPLEPAASAFASPPNRARPAATLSRSPQPLPLFTPANNQTPLEWARLLVQNVRPADTSYRHTGTQVTWAGWPIATGQPDSQTIAADYKSHTDCSGFINALLAQSFGLTTSDFQSWLKTGRPLAETYYSAISSQHGFMRLDNIS